MSRQPRILIDSSLWLKFVLGDKGLSHALRERIDTELLKGRLYLSSIALAEIALMQSQGALTLRQPFERWVEKMLAASKVQVSDVDSHVAVEIERLPKAPQGLSYIEKTVLATARTQGMVLLTERPVFIGYASTGFIKLA